MLNNNKFEQTQRNSGSVVGRARAVTARPRAGLTSNSCHFLVFIDPEPGGYGASDLTRFPNVRSRSALARTTSVLPSWTKTAAPIPK